MVSNSPNSYSRKRANSTPPQSPKLKSPPNYDGGYEYEVDRVDEFEFEDNCDEDWNERFGSLFGSSTSGSDCEQKRARKRRRIYSDGEEGSTEESGASEEAYYSVNEKASEDEEEEQDDDGNGDDYF